MPHRKATPECQRPTIAELEFHEAASRMERKGIAKILGAWDDSEAVFSIEVRGDWADIIEVYETLKESGNLLDIELQEIS